MERNVGYLQLTSSRNWRPTSSGLNLEVDPSPVRSSKETTDVVNTFITVFNERLKQRTQLSHNDS
jgi:hypothetical protein